MIAAVFDSSVVAAACGWTAEPYRCLVLVAQRAVRSYATQEIVAEWRVTIQKMHHVGANFQRSPWPTLEGLIELSRFVTPVPLGKQRSRDSSDDPYLACALAAKARFVVTRDQDLLVLGKPFETEIVTPRAFLSRMHAGT